MSKLKNQIEVDIMAFFENIENQCESDKIQTLRDLLDKYLHLSTTDYMMDYHDLMCIINCAKTLFASRQVPINLGKSGILVSPADIPNLCVIEATVTHLNKKDCLKKMPKFNEKKNK